MNFNERTITEPYTLRGVSTVPEEGGANLFQQWNKAVLPYFTRKKQVRQDMTRIFFRLLSRCTLRTLTNCLRT